MEKIIYLDHAATTPARPEVVEAMMPYFTEKFWNPSSVYSPAAEAKKAVNEVRDRIAESLGTQSQIYFTAGGSERQLGHQGDCRSLCLKGKTHHYKQDRAPCGSSHLPVSGEKRL